MNESISLIRSAMERTSIAGSAPRWESLLGNFIATTSAPISAEVERLLLEILRHEGDLYLDENAAMPHRMAPEKMLKSLALKAIARWTGARFLPTMRRLAVGAKPASFACAVKGVIDTIVQSGVRNPRSEQVVDVHEKEASIAADLEIRPGGYVARAYEIGGMHYEKLILQQDFGMTALPY